MNLLRDRATSRGAAPNADYLQNNGRGANPPVAGNGPVPKQYASAVRRKLRDEGKRVAWGESQRRLKFLNSGLDVAQAFVILNSCR